MVVLRFIIYWSVLIVLIEIQSKSVLLSGLEGYLKSKIKIKNSLFELKKDCLDLSKKLFS